jgi:tripartite-type tricarboxylate transporter receptor subunit TctC
VARLIAPKLSQSFGRPVLVENRPEANGQIAVGIVARSAPDGYTLLIDASSFAMNPSLYPDLPYDQVRALMPITLLARFPGLLMVTPSLPVSSVRDLVALAKARPGQIAFASPGNGSAEHLYVALFQQRADIDMAHVLYGDGVAAMAGVATGQVQVLFAGVTSGWQQVRTGKLKALAITGSARAPNLPDVPTVTEGGVPGYEVYEWNAIFAPAETLPPIILRLNADIAAALKQANVKERIAALNGEIVASTPEETAHYLTAQMRLWAKIVKATGISKTAGAGSK